MIERWTPQLNRWSVWSRRPPPTRFASQHNTATRRIEAIVSRVGFKESLAGGAFGGPKDLEEYPELGIVSDADTLDAIGAIGACMMACMGSSRRRARLAHPALILVPFPPQKKTQGIARCFTFGGARGRPLYDPATLHAPDSATALPPSKDAYAGGKDQTTKTRKNQATVDHFYEKLLHLQGRMRTAEGRRVAAARHVYMEGFLEQLRAEVAFEA